MKASREGVKLKREYSLQIFEVHSTYALNITTSIHTYYNVLHIFDQTKLRSSVGFRCLVILSAGSDTKRTNLSQQSSVHASISRRGGAQDWKGGEEHARAN